MSENEENTEASGLRKLLTDQKAMVGAGLLLVWGAWSFWPESASCEGWDDTLVELYSERASKQLQSRFWTADRLHNFLNQDFRVVAVRTVSKDADVGSVTCEASLHGRQLEGADGSLGDAVVQIARLEYESYVDADGEVWVSLR